MEFFEEKIKEIIKDVNILKWAKYSTILGAIGTVFSVWNLCIMGIKAYFDAYCNNLGVILLVIIILESACILLSKEDADDTDTE